MVQHKIPESVVAAYYRAEQSEQLRFRTICAQQYEQLFSFDLMEVYTVETVFQSVAEI